jgi:hypothetical protein
MFYGIWIYITVFTKFPFESDPEAAEYISHLHALFVQYQFQYYAP